MGVVVGGEYYSFAKVDFQVQFQRVLERELKIILYAYHQDSLYY